MLLVLAFQLNQIYRISVRYVNSIIASGTVFYETAIDMDFLNMVFRFISQNEFSSFFRTNNYLNGIILYNGISRIFIHKRTPCLKATCKFR